MSKLTTQLILAAALAAPLAVLAAADNRVGEMPEYGTQPAVDAPAGALPAAAGVGFAIKTGDAADYPIASSKRDSGAANSLPAVPARGSLRGEAAAYPG